jgi:hypothetical protein
LRGRTVYPPRSGQPWPSREEYYKQYDVLAARFIEHSKLMIDECPEHVREAGLKRLASLSVEQRKVFGVIRSGGRLFSSRWGDAAPWPGNRPAGI